MQRCDPSEADRWCALRGYEGPDGATYPTLFDAAKSLPRPRVDLEGTRAILRGARAISARGLERACIDSIYERIDVPDRLARGPVDARAPLSDESNAREALYEALADATSQALRAPGPVALALSGGLDAALIGALARARGLAFDAVYTLAPAWPSYSELEHTRAIARGLSLSLTEVKAGEHDFVRSFEATARAAAEPIYNLHPAGRVVLAKRMARDGICAVVTGDGADQLFAARAGRDWLPLLRDLAGAGGVELRTPFLAPAVRAAAQAIAPHPEKRALRTLAARVLAPAIAAAPKRTALAPAMDLSSICTRETLVQLDALVPVDAYRVGDAGVVQRASLAVVLRACGALERDEPAPTGLALGS